MATEVQARPNVRRTAVARRVSAGVSGLFDFVTDLAVLGFACWTVLYHVGLIFGLPTNPLLAVWVVSMAPLGWYLRSRRRGPGRGGAPRRGGDLDVRLLALSVALAGCSAVLVFFGSSATWWPGWLSGAAAAGLALRAVLRGRDDGASVADSAPEPRRRVSVAGTWLAAGTAVVLGCLSVFVIHGDADDVFYVNRAAWVAEHGTIPVKDTLYTDQAIPAIRGAGVPVSSVETLQGAVAHVLGVHGGTAAYLLTPPVGVFLAVWALWRLVRAWAPRRRMLCFVVATVYLLWDSTQVLSLGSFFIVRMQQGKAVFAAVLVPLLFLYLTRWVNRPQRRTAVLLAAAGVAAVGLTSSATFLVLVGCAAVAIPLLLTRRYRLAAGSLLPFGYPLIVGVVVHFAYAGLDTIGVSYTGDRALRLVLGQHWFGAIGWLATLCTVWLVRPGGARLATAGIAGVLLVLTAPGIFALMNDLTGAHAVLWRVFWMLPLPALVGVAASVRLPHRSGVTAVLPAAALATVVILAGTPVLHHGVKVATRPTWRYGGRIMGQAWAVVHADRAAGPVLAPPMTMKAIAIATTRVHPVDPRASYRGLVAEPARRRAARGTLAELVQGRIAPVAEVRAALRELHVDLVCLEPEWSRQRSVVQQAGYQELGAVGSQICYRRAAS